MTQMMVVNVCYLQRQFLLTTTPINRIENWNCLQIDGYYLYAHPDLEITRVDDSLKSIVLVGSLFDPTQPEKDNTDIVKDIHSEISNPEDLFLRIKPYAGSYVLLYKDGRTLSSCRMPLCKGGLLLYKRIVSFAVPSQT